MSSFQLQKDEAAKDSDIAIFSENPMEILPNHYIPSLMEKLFTNIALKFMENF